MAIVSPTPKETLPLPGSLPVPPPPPVGPDPRRKTRLLGALLLAVVGLTLIGVAVAGAGGLYFLFGVATVTAAALLLVTSLRAPERQPARRALAAPLIRGRRIPTEERRWIGPLILIASVLLLQILIESVLGMRGFARYIDGGILGTRFIELLFYDNAHPWFPILFLAALFGFGLQSAVPGWIRFAVLGAYAGTMIALVPLAFGGSQTAEDVFFLLMLFSPVPGLFFLFANGRHQWSLLRCTGFALIFAMLWRSIYLSFPDLLVIASGGAVTPPAATSALYRQFFVSVVWDFVYPILGLMFFLHRVPGIHVPLHWGRQLEGLLRPFGAWVRRSWAADVAWGSVLFIVDLIAAVILATILAAGATGDVGDDSAVFNLITVDQVFIIAIIAGVGEELLFRGILQSGLHRLVGTNFLATSIVVLIQAVAFAIVHSGYADLDHVIVPFAFGIFAGYVFRYFGIIPVIMIHVQIDIFAFGASYFNVRQGTEEGTIMAGFLALLFIANIAFGLLYFFLWLIDWWEGRRKALAVLVRS